METKNKIEINEDFKKALNILENTTSNVFLTGKAGTGKSTLLEYFRKNSKKKVVVLAPTGVAALNVKGQTIHSFFHFPPNITPQTVQKKKPSAKFQELVKKLDTIVIDEVSMVRADLLDCIDTMLRMIMKTQEPFGGIQMVFIGDLYQLPPVVGRDEKEFFNTYYNSPYFFDAHSFDRIEIEFIELGKIYRQKEYNFIELLNKIRNNSIEYKDIQQLNSRYIPYFNMQNSDDFYITLTTTNSSADTINSEELLKLDTRHITYDGETNGKFESKYIPTSLTLDIKIGAQIMLLNNDAMGRWVNGTIGKLTGIQYNDDNEEDELIVELLDGAKVRVQKYKWELYRYSFNKEQSKLESEVIGSFTQYPVRLAWAVTIHKSQGKTFDRVIVDIGQGAFAHGQVYVAISRCTNFEGLVLKKPILKKHIWTDASIGRFLEKFNGVV